MQQIKENDYYAIFQTGLFIAVKEHGAKQAQLADLCKVNPSYLSKLKGWDIHKTTKELVAKPFSLEAILGFDHYAQHAGDGTETANAGIILGWRISEGREQYYNLLLNGQRMLLELVGARTGNQYSDFEHLHEGVPFVVEDGRIYHFKLHVTPEFITVNVDDELRYQIATPPDIEGRAGIRPWRAALECQYFELLELPTLPKNAL